jgi:tetratricopeptide (TPR) repeat protein
MFNMNKILCIWLLFFSTFSFAQQIEDKELLALKKLAASDLPQQKKLQLELKLVEFYIELSAPARSVDSVNKYLALAFERSKKLNSGPEKIEAEIFKLRALAGGRNNSEAELLIRSLEGRTTDKNQKGHINFSKAIIASSRNENQQAIKFFKQSAEDFEAYGNIKWLGRSYMSLLNELTRIEDFVLAIDYARKLSVVVDKLSANKKESERSDLIGSGLLTVMGKLYEFGGDYETAKRLIRQQIDFGIKNDFITNPYQRLASVYWLEGKYDSSIYFIKKQLGINQPSFQLNFELSKYYLFNRQYEEALKITGWFLDTLPMVRTSMPFTREMYPRYLLVHSAANAALGNKADGERHLMMAMKEIKHPRPLTQQMDEYRFLTEVMSLHGNFEQAFFYKQRYQHIRDSLFGGKYLFMLDNAWRMAEMEKNQAQMALLENQLKLNEQLYKEQVYLKLQKEAELELLDVENQLKGKLLLEDSLIKNRKEADIQQLKIVMGLKDEQLRKETLIRNLALAGILFILFIGGTFYRNLRLKRRNQILEVEKKEQLIDLQQLHIQKTDAEFRQQVAQLEMQALRAQMNPHFIFNCLSSINWLIIEGNNEAASDYLNRFSRLIRMVLKNSGKSTISLADELSMLKLYLKMEGLRFDHSFHYEINHPEDLDLHGYSVPPLLLQPFCENAIWHGLLNKNGDRELKINIAKHKDDLYCTITDNGIGRKLSKKTVAEKLSGHQSMGLKLTSERLALFNEQENSQTMFEMEDLINDNGESAGTKVMIRIKSVNYKEKDL